MQIKIVSVNIPSRLFSLIIVKLFNVAVPDTFYDDTNVVFLFYVVIPDTLNELFNVLVLFYIVNLMLKHQFIKLFVMI